MAWRRLGAAFCDRFKDCFTCTSNGGGDQLCGWCQESGKCILAKAAGLDAGFISCSADEPCDPKFKDCCAQPCKENPSECDAGCNNFIGNYKLKNPTYYTSGNKTGNPNPLCPGYYTNYIKCEDEPKCCTASSEETCLKTDYGGLIKCGWCAETSTCDVAKYSGFTYTSISGAPTCALNVGAASTRALAGVALLAAAVAAVVAQH